MTDWAKNNIRRIIIELSKTQKETDLKFQKISILCL